MRLFLLLFIAAAASYGQEIVVLRDGKKLDIKKLKAKKNGVVLTLLSGEKREVDDKEIALIVDTKKEEEFFWKSTGYDKVYYDESVQYAKVTRVVHGKINVFEYYTKSMTSTGTGTSAVSSSRELLCEKENVLREVPTGGLLAGGNEDRLQLIESLVRDNSRLSEQLSTRNKKIKIDDFLRIVKQYNVDFFDNHKLVKPVSLSNLINAVIYTNEKLQPDSYLLLNDSIKHAISSSSIANIKLPAGRATKICLVQGDSKICDLIEPSLYLSNYWSIKLDEGMIELTRERKVDAQRNITLILSKRKK